MIRQAIEQERGCCAELLNYRKDGKPFWNRLCITPVHDGSEGVTHYIGVHTDVTRRKKAEEALRKSIKELEKANEKIREDLEAAARLQKSLLPDRLPEIEGLKFAWMLESCDELAGDTLNVVRLDDERIGMYVVDVSGHGVPAALLSVTLNRWMSSNRNHSVLFRPDPDSRDGFAIASPGEVASNLNALFPMDLETHQYLTILYGIYDIRTRLFKYASTGHPPPIYVPVDGDATILPGEGFPVGFVAGAKYEEHRITLRPGDRLYLYSDGIIEALNRYDEDFGAGRLVKTIQKYRHAPLQETLSEILKSMNQWADNTNLQDDVSMLATQVK
jgi:sigma-B regulation protein RsbU (phosphoserine phosphatase)